jgi:thioredoxin 1
MIHPQHATTGSAPVLIYFFSPLSDGCKVMDAVFHDLKDHAGNRATLLALDIELHHEYRDHYGVMAVPEIMLFQQGHIVWRKSGVVPLHEIMDHLRVPLADDRD